MEVLMTQLSLFGETIFTYSRSQAIEDGVLIDVTAMAKEQGIRFPVAITTEFWHTYIVPPQEEDLSCQSIEGRLWDTLWLFRCAAAGCPTDRIMFYVHYVMESRKIKKIRVKSICGPGDQGEPVITIMLPNED